MEKVDKISKIIRKKKERHEMEVRRRESRIIDWPAAALKKQPIEPDVSHIPIVYDFNYVNSPSRNQVDPVPVTSSQFKNRGQLKSNVKIKRQESKELILP